MPVSRHFSTTYQEARDKFRDAVRHARVPLETFVHPVARAPDGTELSTDVAYFGSPDAPNLLVIVSGVHGLEGFTGSGCQVALIERVRLTALPMHCAVLLVHAVDPYGFAWLRRANEHNVDLNANAVDHRHLPESPALYDELHPMLLAGADPMFPGAGLANAQLSQAFERHGELNCVEAITAGQYHQPDGLCYGGSQLEWSTLTFFEIMRR